jgi:hypothetical protein
MDADGGVHDAAGVDLAPADEEGQFAEGENQQRVRKLASVLCIF